MTIFQSNVWEKKKFPKKQDTNFAALNQLFTILTLAFVMIMHKFTLWKKRLIYCCFNEYSGILLPQNEIECMLLLCDGAYLGALGARWRGIKLWNLQGNSQGLYNEYTLHTPHFMHVYTHTLTSDSQMQYTKTSMDIARTNRRLHRINRSWLDHN